MLADKFQKFIRDNALVSPGDRVLLTVSGGVDSMVMLSLFAEAGYDIGVAHCNFGLRGPEADEDEVAVAAAAKCYGVPFYNRRFDTKGEMERTGESVQMAARRLRYTWFEDLSRAEGYDSIAIAHHADDSIETFFINLLRGTGLKGLTGIHAVRGRVIRPLLFASRREILDYAKAHAVRYREDSTNGSTKYLRNKLRLGIVPRLREITPRLTEVMSVDIQRLTDAQLFINRGIEMIRSAVVESRDGMDIIDPSRIDAAFPTGFVIYELMNSAYGFRGDTVDRLCAALRAGATGKRFYSKDHVAYVDRGRVIISPIAPDDDCLTELPKESRKTYCGNGVLYVDYTDIDNVETLVTPETVALLDADRLEYPLVLRRWHEGDWFVPFGMNGRKKVSDFLVDAKVPVAEKRRQFVLLSGEDIVWLIGRRIDDRFKVGPKTENIMKIVRETV